ncbi:MAG TPA: hypothetical protein VKD90_04310 [Gemmataceae bacterium]|nr:hypothetical protein [Gemmataceae bacterium]
MPEWLSRQLPESWGTTQLVLAAAVFTVTTAVVSIVVTAAVLVRLPHDYFAGDPRSGAYRTRPRYIHWPLLVLKNFFGVVLVVLGVVLSLPGVPGQGILTILIGAMLIDFPGKRRVERWLLHRRGVLGTINKVRARYGRPPLVLDVPTVPA